MAMEEKELQTSYDADQIQVLEGLEAVRKRPGMYIGSTSSKGLHHLVWEIVDNSIDEALAGYCDHITVTIEKDNWIRVEDNGRGIPVSNHEKMGKPAVEVIMTVLHAGGKFGGGGYKVSGGLHGVGASVVNALSKSLRLTINRNGKKYFMEFENGEAKAPLKQIGTAKGDNGTQINFIPSQDIFSSTKFSFSILNFAFATEVLDIPFDLFSEYETKIVLSL